jgi:3-methyladenine DNA glycosylase/8-oxoguanine DNA glycosylase
VGKRAHDALVETVARMFRLDEDLSGFYALVGDDPDLSWSALGAGRMLRAPTVFEDVVKTN